MNSNGRAKCRPISGFKLNLPLPRSESWKDRVSRNLLVLLTAGLAVWPVVGAGQISGTATGNQTTANTHTIMHPDQETMLKWFQAHAAMPKAPMASQAALLAPGASLSLLSHLNYVPSQRDQGYCGNCWCWAGHGCLEILLHVQTGIFDRLSVQEMNSCETAVIGKACCDGGWLDDVQDFYRASGYQRAVPWSNPGASWQDRYATCATPCANITTTPSYRIQSITARSISTHGVGQAQAIANIKAILNQNKPVAFAFFLAKDSDWNTFYNTWDIQAESTTVDFDYACGHTWDSGGGGHEVLCVGYNDEDPNDSYWIMVNSWGTTANRPNDIFHVKMNGNYDCTFYDGWSNYSYFWEYLDVTYATGPVITQQPQSTAVCAGANAIFSVIATGNGPFVYQWQTNSVNLVNGGHYSGVTTANLTVLAADSVVATSYRCLVSNAGGSVTSTVATLTVNSRPTAAVSGSATISSGGTTTIQAALTGTGPWNLMWSDGSIQNGVVSSPATRIVGPSATTSYALTALNDAHCTTQAGDLTGSALVTVTSQTPFQTWQLEYFGCTNCTQAADSADPDGDGSDNLQEFLAGGDPTNGVSYWAIQASPTNGTQPLTVSFTENSSSPSITNRLWSFGNGDADSGTNPGHTYTNAGTFSVGLTIFNLNGTTTLTATNLITVSSAPTTILADAGDLFGSTTNDLAPTNSVAVLVVDTGNNGFAALQSAFPLNLGAMWGTDDKVVGLWDLTACNCGDGQLYDQTVVTYTNGVSPGQKLQLYWFPSLTLASNTLGVTHYGKYTDTNSPALDGSDDWQMPASGSSVHLRFWTTFWTGSNPETTGLATLFTGGSSFAAWQQQYFGCTACPEAAEDADPDGDGQNNLAEFLAGTVPTNSTSAFRITAITSENNNLRVTWTMGGDKTNALQASAGEGNGSYSTNNFSDIFTVTNTVGSFTNFLDVDAATNFPSRFYRIRLVP